MERGYRDIGRAGLAGADYDDYRGYSRQGASAYLDHDPPLRDSYLGSPGSSYRTERSSYGGTSSYSRERDVMESLIQQRALQQQLSLRESQLALANSMLQQQQQQRFYMKRGMEPRDHREDFKRPRMMDSRSRPRSRLGGRDSMAGSRSPRGSSGSRRNPSASHGRGPFPSDKRKTSKEKYNPEKPTGEEGGEKERGSKGQDEENLKKHLSSDDHKNKATSGGDKTKGQGHCNICDVVLDVTFLQHQRLTFHKKRKIQVLKGCGWCSVTSFKNFSEVLVHRATEKHIKNQKIHEKRDDDRERDNSKSRSRGRGRRKPVKVELPPELNKFDPKVIVGQSCVVSVTGWFCKLCNKFYNNESAAKETHCMTETHFNNYKNFMYTKLKQKAEAEREAKEKAAEEEERKKKEAGDEQKTEDDTQPPSQDNATESQQLADEQQQGEEVCGEEEYEDQNGGGEDAHLEGEDAAEDIHAEEENEILGEGEEQLDGEEEEEEVAEAGEEEGAEAGEEEGAEGGEENLEEGAEITEVGEEQAGAEDLENMDISSQEQETSGLEEHMEGEGEEEEEEDEKAEEEKMEEESPRKATRRSVARGRGRGAGANKTRRGGRRGAK